MTRFILTLTIFLMIACGKTNRSTDKSSLDTNNLTIDNRDSVTIKNLVNNESKYIRHSFIDFDNDSNTELMIISESNQNSECLSMWDTTCVFVDIDLYRLKNKKWELFKDYQIDDSKNTLIRIDSSLNLIIKQSSKPSGLSKKYKTEFYDLKDGDFFLREIDLMVDTKINSNFGSDKDSWKYFVDFKSKVIRLEYSELRTIKDIDGEPDLSSVETIISRELTDDITIKLGEHYNIDSLFFDGYEIQY